MGKRMLAKDEIADKIRQQQDVIDMMTSCLSCAYKINGLSEGFPLRFLSDSFWQLLGYTSLPDFMEGVAGLYENAVYLEDLPKLQAAVELQLAAGDTFAFEYRLKKKDEGYLWVKESGKRIDEENGLILKSVVVDITELKASQEALRRKKDYDDLTGLYNRKAFYVKVAELFAKCPEESFEIMYLDIERFKILNQLFGEATGNRLIIYIADCLKELDVENTVCSRFLSDDFMICFPTGENNRKKIIEAIQTKIDQFSLAYRVAVGFGIYKITDRYLSVKSMCDRAKMAFRQIQGKYLTDCGEYDEVLQQKVIAEHNIINEMGKALLEHQFKVYLQPKYDLSTEKITGAEALVRWDHPARGLISPAEFIPVFERNGFIMQLDEYIWEEVCRLLRQWIDAGRAVMPVSVNVSRFDLYNNNLCEVLTGFLEKYDIPANLLELEITESAYMENPKQIIDITKKLQSKGFIILMDDFGSGYSSLNMLKDVPVDILKIDMKFLDGDDESGRGNNILNSVVRMAKWLQTPVITEGVENKSQVDFLRAIGCNCVQGYYYSKPVCVNEYEKLLQEDEQKNQQHLPLPEVVTKNIWDPNVQLNILFNSVNGSMGLYELSNGILEALRVNDGFFEMFGYSSEDFYKSARQTLDYIVPEDRPIVLEMLAEAAKHNGIANRQIRHYHKDGSVMLLQVKARSVVKEEGSQLFYIALEDITEWQNTSLRLQEMFDNIPAGFGVYELEKDEMKVCLQSAGMYKINGHTKKALGKPIHEKLSTIIGLDNMRKLLQATRDSYNKKQTLQIKYPFLRADGVVRWAWAAANTIREEKTGHLICYAVVNDITENQQSEAKIELMQARSNMILDMVQQEMWEYNIGEKRLYLRADILHSNASRDTQLIVSPEDIVGEGHIHPDYVKSYFSVFDQLCYGVKSADWVGLFRKTSGSYTWVHKIYRTIFNEQGKPIRAIGMHEEAGWYSLSGEGYSIDEQEKMALTAGVIATYKIDFSADKVMAMESFHDLKESCRRADSFDAFMALLARFSVNDAGSQKLRAIFNRENILRAYAKGQQVFKQHWCILDKTKKVCWLEVSLTIESLGNGEIILGYGKITDCAANRDMFIPASKKILHMAVPSMAVSKKKQCLS